MRVVVTGGAGFIGSRVVKTLLAQAADVTVLDSLRPDVHDSPDLAGLTGAAFVRADVRDRDAVAGGLRGADVVVHLAAMVGLGVDLDDVEDYVSSNDLGTAVVLREMRAAVVQRLVYASSMVVYGEGAYDCPEHGRVAPAPRRAEDLAAGAFEPGCPRCARELTPQPVGETAPLDPRNVYAATKLHGEHLAACWARETDGTALAQREGDTEPAAHAGYHALVMDGGGQGARHGCDARRLRPDRARLARLRGADVAVRPGRCATAGLLGAAQSRRCPPLSCVSVPVPRSARSRPSCSSTSARDPGGPSPSGRWRPSAPRWP